MKEVKNMEYKMALKRKEFALKGFRYSYVLYSRANENENFTVVKDVTDASYKEYSEDKKLCN